jgi:small subunit ribosomal protein S2
VIPGNDDATRAIRVYAQVLADAVIEARGANTVGGRGDEFVEVEGEGEAKAAAKPRGRGKAPAPKKETKVETKVRRHKVETPEGKE